MKKYTEPPNDVARVIEVIETTITRRGNGTSEPIRIVRQYWTLDGMLLAENDPYIASPSSPDRAPR